MSNLNYHDVLFMLAMVIASMGFITFMLGVFVLVGRALGREMRTLAAQTSQLAQKGLGGELPGLVGNASLLFESIQRLVKTAQGIGVFLVLLGTGLIVGSVRLFQMAYGII